MGASSPACSRSARAQPRRHAARPTVRASVGVWCRDAVRVIVIRLFTLVMMMAPLAILDLALHRRRRNPGAVLEHQLSAEHAGPHECAQTQHAEEHTSEVQS